MNRYSKIETKLPREFLLLQGTGCRWHRCTFCNYYEDVCPTPFAINRPILEQVTGEFGVLDIINSGSAMELDAQTIALIKEVVKQKHIHTLWFEAHYMYRHQLSDFAAQFEGVDVKFRCGIESFSPEMRRRWNKGVADDVTAADVAKYFKGVCLLCCTDGDSRERIIEDIELAEKYFEYLSINLFCENGTSVHRNEQLAQWFVQEIYPLKKSLPHIEILIDNRDLGVGE